MSPMTETTVPSNALSALLDWYATLTPESLLAIGRYYQPQARFVDPFNDVRGHAAIRMVFEHMFDTVNAPRFHIETRLMGLHEGFAAWQFSGAVRGRRFTVPGSSRLRFGDDGRVIEHQDFWDAATLWRQMPLIGLPVGWLQRRFAAPAP